MATTAVALDAAEFVEFAALLCQFFRLSRTDRCRSRRRQNLGTSSHTLGGDLPLHEPLYAQSGAIPRLEHLLAYQQLEMMDWCP